MHASPHFFICYRRSDTAPWAGRLHDRLAQVFGADKVFFDVHGIEPGEDFARVLDERLAQCKVMLVVVGRQWLSVREQDGTRSIDEPKDYVRREIKAALDRNIRVVPVLVNGASMPGEHELPSEIRSLTHRQAIELTHARFLLDAQTLIETLTRAALREAGDGSALLVEGPVRDRLAAAGGRGDRYRVALLVTAGFAMAGMVASVAIGQYRILTWFSSDRGQIERGGRLRMQFEYNVDEFGGVGVPSPSAPEPWLEFIGRSLAGGGWVPVACSLLLFGTHLSYLVISHFRTRSTYFALIGSALLLLALTALMVTWRV